MALLERDGFLQQLGDLFRQAARGRGVLVLLGGEAGVGKTVLVHAFATSLPPSVRLAAGACDPLSTPRPLGPLLDAAPALGIEPILEEASRPRIFHELLADLRAKPTVVVFEDVHWADEATLDLLRYLGRRIDTTSTLLVATYRNDEIGRDHPLRLVMGDLATARLERIALTGLSPAAVARLAEGRPFDPDELHRQTNGNPFFVTEVLASGAPGLPATVRDAVLTRAARLSRSGRAVLEAAAVIGGRVEPWLLGEVVSAEMTALDECLAAGALRSQATEVTFRHELARQGILEAIPPHRRQALHRLVLAALEAQPEARRDPARLAHHAEAALAREAVLAYAPEAAERAAALGAHREATAQYARALRFADGLPAAERALLLERHAWEGHLTGRLADAIASRGVAIELWRRQGDRFKEGENLARLAHTLVLAGQNAEGEAASRAAVDLLEALPHSPELALAYRFQSYLRMLDRDSDEAVAWGEKAIALAERFGDVDTLAHSYNSIGSALIVAGEVDRGREVLERSLRLAIEADLEYHIANAYSNLGSAAGEVYRFDLADHYLALAVAFETERELDAGGAYASAWQALAHLYQGRWDEAADLARALLKRPQLAAVTRIMALLALGRLRARRGDPGVDEVLDEALALALETGTLQRLGPVRAARAEAAWQVGDAERTRTEARAAFDLALRKRHAWFVGELAYWCWKAGDLGEAPTLAAEPFALQMAGRWLEAAERWQALGCPYEAARASVEGDDEAHLKGALDTFERLGAQPAARVLRERMHDLGITGIPRGPRPSTLANPAGLTRRELEVLRLVARGMTNAQIAGRLRRSEKTVGHHVSSILAKLEVKNRVEAVAEALRRGILAPE